MHADLKKNALLCEMVQPQLTIIVLLLSSQVKIYSLKVGFLFNQSGQRLTNECIKNMVPNWKHDAAVAADILGTAQLS